MSDDDRAGMGAAAAAALANGGDGGLASTASSTLPSAATPDAPPAAAGGDADTLAGAAADGGQGGTAAAAPTLSAIEQAAQRAEARLAAAKTTDSAPGAAEQAGGDADSTPKVATGGDGADGDGPEQAGGDADSIPGLQHWPAARREALAKLPQEAQGVVREIAGELQAGFTKATQTLSTIRKELPELAAAVLDEGVAPGRVLDYARAGKLFEQNPQQALRALAQQAGLEVRFPGDPEPDAMPEFQTSAELAQWLAEQQDRKLAARERAFIEQQQQRQYQQALQQELAAAQAQYPDLDPRAVLDAIARSNGMLTAEQAHLLPKLRETVQSAEALRTENASLKAKLAALEAQGEQRTKRLLDVGGRRDGGAPVNGADDGLPVIERAARAAERRLAMRG